MNLIVILSQYNPPENRGKTVTIALVFIKQKVTLVKKL